MAEPVRRRSVPLPNIDALLSARVRQGVGAALADVHGEVVFEVQPAGVWTLRLDSGRVYLRRGATRSPTTVVRVDPRTFADILQARCSGVEAFLSGSLTVRGDLSLSLAIDGAFDVGERPPEFPAAHYTSVLGARTFYLEAGRADAPPVLLLHGLGATNASMLPLLPALARRYRVIAPDTPGFGASDAPHWSYAMGEMATWLCEFQRAVRAPTATMIGNSLGGRLAIEAALSNPATVDRLVLLCPSPAFRRLRQLVPVVKLVSPNLSRLPMVLPQTVAARTLRFMFAQPDRLPHDWRAAAVDEFCRVMRDGDHRRAFFASLRHIYLEEAYGEHGFWDRLTRLDAPALFIWGQQDPLVPASFERHVVNAVPQATSVVLPNCGHVPQFEMPERTNALVAEFLAAP